MSYENPWQFENQIVDDDTLPDDAVAFVYLITNTVTGRQYIGKKTLFFRRKKIRKGKRAKRVTSSSDWKSYYGSSEELNADVAQCGPAIFARRILRFCKSKGEASYFECKYIFEADALINENFYNHWVSCKIRRAHLRNISL